jgi:hypothetical protein
MPEDHRFTQSDGAESTVLKIVKVRTADATRFDPNPDLPDANGVAIA